MKRLEYYKHLRKIGVKEKHAIKMAEQASSSRREESTSPANAVMSFAIWDDTAEGQAFWDAAHDKYIAKSI